MSNFSLDYKHNVINDRKVNGLCAPECCTSLPLSYQQQSLWFTHEYMDGQETAYNMLMTFSLDAAVSI
ncbi:hypothetical protein, partial [Vibrio sp. 10N.237.312.B06]|uniref:hypothetical protein n=1 Tax=Vibrio sp. 10N.237.312.B06 TaxID=3229974 RepID=UPI00354E7BA8